MTLQLPELDYIFSVSEAEAADILQVCPRTVATRRRDGRLPSYLYRNCGTDKRPWYRYNSALLKRWAVVPPEKRDEEEQWAKAAIENYWRSVQIAPSKSKKN